MSIDSMRRYAEGTWYDANSPIGKRVRMMDRMSPGFGMTGRVVDAFHDGPDEFLVIDWDGWRTTMRRGDGRIRLEG